MTKKDSKEMVLFIAKKLHLNYVYNMIHQEGNPFSFVEVQTLLGGVTVGGHYLSDQQQVLRVSDGWKELINIVENDTFELNKETAIKLNSIIAKDESLEWGRFRTGSVSISGTYYKPPQHEELNILFNTVVDKAKDRDNVEEMAFNVFLDFAQNQFFWDGNKRTGQLMMNGILLSNGKPSVSIPAELTKEYNQKMLNFYNTSERKEVVTFLKKSQTLTNQLVKVELNPQLN